MFEKKQISEEELKFANGGENKGVQLVCPHCTEPYWTTDCIHDGIKILCPNCKEVLAHRGN